LNVGGIELAVRDDGGDRRAFVWAHGLASSMALEDEAGVIDWSNVRDDSAHRSPRRRDGWRLVRYDARGHGDSGGGDDASEYSLDSLAGDLLGLLDALSIQRAVLGGASLGALTAIQAAVLAPDRVDALVVALPPAAGRARRVPSVMLRGAARTVELLGKAAFLRTARLTPPPPILRGELAPFARSVVEGFDRLDRRRLATILRVGAALDLPAPETLLAVAAPTLLLGWVSDPGHPVATIAHLAQLWPDAECHVAADAAAVRAWPDLVERFLTGLA
jgi:pimeloyl-ACP methyl ester carboxylesterase